MELPEGTHIYTRQFTENCGGKMHTFHQTMIEVSPFHSVNEDSFRKLYGVRSGKIARLSAVG
ncbi:hypothetical protein [Shinella zoogloeoides]|uniref:hypothetical protein n=1 Tax=Shinella zoogloeoides TaxID=352475 RepID=UPI001F59AF2F|nr:hypothetical protein [Shinella zoogloeoides]